jgi:phage baseplate assembly protein W
MAEQSGFPFPAIRRGFNGPLAYVSKNTLELVKSSVYQILTTAPGERTWNPEFGCDIQKLIFDTITETVKETISTMVYEALITWEPRITLSPSDVNVIQESNSISIHVAYNLTVPAESQSDSILVAF